MSNVIKVLILDQNWFPLNIHIFKGNVGLPCSSVANAMRRALEKFVGNHQTTNALRKINIVVFDKNLLADFRNGVLKTADVQKGLMAKIKGNISKHYIICTYFVH